MSKVVDFPKGSKGGGDDGTPPSDKSKRGGPRKPRPVDHSIFEHLQVNFALIYTTDTVVDIQRRVVMKVSALRLAYGTDAVKVWLNSPSRQMIQPEQLVFDPTGVSRPPEVNLFDKLPIEPKQGECGKIEVLLLHLCGGRMEIYTWVEKWLAYQFVHVGAKMRTAILMHGDEGSGKNLFWGVISELFGRYSITIGQDQIESKYNDWISCKLFIVGDEIVTRHELVQQKGRLLAYITSPRIMVEAKMMPVRAERNHANFVFNSNETEPIRLSDSDRRYLVIRTPAAQDAEFYTEVAEQIRSGGPQAYMWHLMNEVDLSEFSEDTKPPITEDKRTLIQLGMPAPKRFFEEWYGGLIPVPYGVTTTGLLYRAFGRWCTSNGERFPPSLVKFVAEIERFASARKLTYRRERKRISEHTDNGLSSDQVQRTLVIVGDLPPGELDANWIDDQIGQFIGGLKAMGDHGIRT